MVESTEQDPTIYVGAATVTLPLVDVVRLAVRRGPVAARPAASAVAHRERDPLPRREQPLLPADLERIAARIHRDRHVAAVAHALIGDLRRKGDDAVLAVCHTVAGARRVHHLHQTYAGLSRAEHRLGVGEGSGTQYIEEQVVRELIVRPLVGAQLFGALSLGGVDETWPAPSRPQRTGENRLGEQAALIVEQERAAPVAVGIRPQSEAAARVPLEEAPMRAVGIESVAHRARLVAQLFQRARLRLRDKLLCGIRPAIPHRFRRRLTQPEPDRVLLPRGDPTGDQRRGQRRIPHGRRRLGIRFTQNRRRREQRFADPHLAGGVGLRRAGQLLQQRRGRAMAARLRKPRLPRLAR